MELSTKNPAQKLYSTVLLIFAIVGFLASVTTIITAFRSDQPSLSAKVYPSNFKFPYYFYAAVGNGFENNGRTFIDALHRVCMEEDDTQGSKLTKNPDDAGVAARACSHTEGLKFLSDQITEAYEVNGTIFDIVLENNGSKKATGIRLEGRKVLYIDTFADGSRIKVDYNRERGTYNIPDINPGESLRIEIWSRGNSYNYDPLYDFEIPKITYNGSIIKLQQYSYVPDEYYEIFKFFRDMGFIFSTIVIVAASFLICIPIIIVMSMLEALLKGKPVFSVFDNKEKFSAAGDS